MQKFIPVETRQEAEDAAPWATIIIAVDGGFMVFESIDDAVTWQSDI